MVSQFGHDVFFEAYGAVEVLRVRRVVRSTICKHPLHVRDEQTAIAVVVGLETLRHCFEVHGVLDVVVVVGDSFSIDGLKKRPVSGKNKKNCYDGSYISILSQICVTSFVNVLFFRHIGDLNTVNFSVQYSNSHSYHVISPTVVYVCFFFT